MSLVRAERRRFVKRRMLVWSLVIFAVLMAAIAAIIFFTSHAVTAEDRAAAQAKADANYQTALRGYEQHQTRCESSPTSDECRYPPEPPQREWFRAEHYMPNTFGFHGASGDMVMVWAMLLSIIAFIIGASFVGAEWRSGAMMNLLTWRPKRMQVLGTKLGVLLGWLTVLGVVSFGLWTAALAGIASTRGTLDGMTQGAWQSYGLAGLRGLAMVLAFAALGFGLASIGKHIGLALGVALGVIILGQFGLVIVLSLARVHFPEQYLIPTHIEAWMEKSTRISDPFWEQDPLQNCRLGGCEPPTMIISFGESGSIALGIVAFVLAIAFVQMKTRDITS
jgi:ABC-2 type transport system permease protein